MATTVLEGRDEEPGAVEAVLHALAELFANGLVHHRVADGEVLRVVLDSVTVRDSDWFTLSVTDSGGGRLRAPAPDSDALGGRGLVVVRNLGAKITDLLVPTGYRVTAWIGATGAVRERVCRCDCLTSDHPERVCAWLLPTEEIPASGTDPICRQCATAPKPSGGVRVGTASLLRLRSIRLLSSWSR